MADHETTGPWSPRTLRDLANGLAELPDDDDMRNLAVGVDVDGSTWLTDSGAALMRRAAAALDAYADELERRTSVHVPGSTRRITIQVEAVDAGGGGEAVLHVSGQAAPATFVLSVRDTLNLEIESGAGELATAVLREFDWTLAENATTPDRHRALEALRSVAQAHREADHG